MAFPPPPTHSLMLMQPNEDSDHNHHLPSPSCFSSFPSCSPHLFSGGGGGGQRHFMMKRSMSFSGTSVNFTEGLHQRHGEDDMLSDYEEDGSQSQQQEEEEVVVIGEKKKMRLNMEQVKALERSFELGNKLEGERKMELAKALGLQPRQVSIWFQNRRARWKTKQLEKDYEVLKKQFDALKSHNDALLAHNKILHAQLIALKTRDPNEVIGSGRSDHDHENSACDYNLLLIDISKTTPMTPTTSPPVSSSQTNTKHLFSTSAIPQLLIHGSSRSSDSDLNSQMKIDDHDHDHLGHHHHQDEDLCSIMFNGMDEQQQQEQQGFCWQWQEHMHPFL